MAKPNTIRCALIQMGVPATMDWRAATAAAPAPREIVAAMTAKHVDLIHLAGKQQVKILCLQECFNSPYFCPFNEDKWFAVAETVPDGDTTRTMRDLARKYEMVIVVPLFERDGNDFYNTAVVIDANGDYLGKYRKTHVPHVEGLYSERYHFKEGNLGYPVFETRYAKIGVIICFDRHFPEVGRILGLKGAQIVFNPSATPAGLSKSIWFIEQPAIAIANNFFMGCVNRVGEEAKQPPLSFYGLSYFCDSLGNILCKAKEDQEELLIADLDLATLSAVDSRWKFFSQRRPDTYSLISSTLTPAKL